MKFDNLLKEDNIPSVGLIFGRFNPPHKGHKAAWEMMAGENADWYVGTNQNTQGKKDPLPYEIKASAMEAVWPEIKGHIVPHQSWLTIASMIYDKHGAVELRVYTDEDWVIKALNSYNGVEKPHGFYNFAKITPVKTPRLSSATAVRQAVADGDREAFADAMGVDSDFKVQGKDFFDIVSHYLLGTELNESTLSKVVNNVLEADLEEGINDPHIFKAVFLAGGPGSGKSFVANKMLTGSGLKPVNSDDIYEYLMQKQDMDMSDPEVIASPQGQETRNRAKELTKKRENMYLDGRLGLIIDGTGKDVAKVKRANDQLKELGYSTMMLFVNTSEDIAQQRNQQRPRSIPREMVSKMWQTVQQNIMKFQQLFGASNFHVVDNSGGLEDPDRKQNFLEVTRAIDKFLNQPPNMPAAKQWMAVQTEPKTESQNLDEGSLVVPPHAFKEIVIGMIEDLDPKDDTLILAKIARLFNKSVFYKGNKVVVQSKDFDGDGRDVSGSDSMEESAINEEAADYVRDMMRVHGWSRAKAEAEAKKRYPEEYGINRNAGRNIEIRIDGKAWKVVGNENHARAIINTLKKKGKKAEGYYTDKPVSESKTVVEESLTEEQFDEAAGEKDACYHKVKSRYKVWPSAYASGALVKCRKVGAKNWGNSKKK